jgi:hypothetical protein
MSELKRPDLIAQVDAKRGELRAALNRAEAAGEYGGAPFGHAFLWGYVTVTFKNGKTREYRECLTSVCADDLSVPVAIANAIPGIRGVWYNLD